MANYTTWLKMMSLYEKTHDSMLLESLTCSENHDIIIKYLDLIATERSIFSDKIHYFVFHIIIMKHARNKLVLDYILKHLERLKPK
jgi:hypothetical protein